MTMIAMFVVFPALAILYVIFRGSDRFFIKRGAKATKSDSGRLIQVGEEMSGEVNAAIAGMLLTTFIVPSGLPLLGMLFF